MDLGAYARWARSLRIESHAAFAPLVEHGFEHVERHGSLPHVRVEMPIARHRTFIDFWMAPDSRGREPHDGDRTVPFELSGGAFLDQPGTAHVTRYRLVLLVYARRPYDTALHTLRADVARLAEIVTGWTDEDILDRGTPVAFGTVEWRRHLLR